MDSIFSSNLGRDLRQTLAVGCCLVSMLLSMPGQAASSPVWTSAATFGGSESDRGQAVKVDRNGNRYVTGAFSATAGFPVRAAQTDVPLAPSRFAVSRKTLTSAGGTDVFLAKYDSTGTLIWVLQAGGSSDDEGF